MLIVYTDDMYIDFTFDFLNTSFSILLPADPCKAFPCEAPHSICQRDGIGRKCTCNTDCPQLIDRVCGSDGRTYDNECLMRLRACQTNSVISVLAKGACRGIKIYSLIPNLRK